MDVGLLNHVCGLDATSIEAMNAVRLVNEGGVAEPYVGQQLASLSGGEQPPELHFWLRHARKGNAEVDYVISHGDWIVPIEVKAGSSGSLIEFVGGTRQPAPNARQSVRRRTFDASRVAAMANGAVTRGGLLDGQTRRRGDLADAGRLVRVVAHDLAQPAHDLRLLVV